MNRKPGILAVGLMFLFSLGRWILQLRRSLTRGPISSTLRERPTEAIAPEDLSEWLETVATEEVDPKRPVE